MLVININNGSTQQKVEKVSPPLLKTKVLMITAVWSSLAIVEAATKHNLGTQLMIPRTLLTKRNSDVSLTLDFLLCADFKAGVSWSA